MLHLILAMVFMDLLFTWLPVSNGFHVFIGTIFILVAALRIHHFSTEHMIGFEAAAWYWHFVDVVWLFLFVSIYWWGSA